MKKLKPILFLLFSIGLSCIMLAQNPIPSFNVPVFHVANFQEKSNSDQVRESGKGRRILNTIIKRNDGQSSCEATVWVYSLDQQDIYGPFTVSCEEILSVEIDEREWGVLVQSDDHVYVDVWIEEENLLKEQTSFQFREQFKSAITRTIYSIHL